MKAEFKPVYMPLHCVDAAANLVLETHLFTAPISQRDET